MSVYFGTDGIRGIANSTLTHEIAFKCGNALTMLKESAKVVICRDTRLSGDLITASLTAGILAGGGSTIDCGILPTASMSFAVKNFKADFGIVISASHNTFEYNGIKIFGSDGCKLTEPQEEQIEDFFSVPNIKTGLEIGKSAIDFTTKTKYEEYLKDTCKIDLNGLKISLDCANGAAYSIAPKVFNELSIESDCINCDIENGIINDNCGSLFPEIIKRHVLNHKCNAGFSFDGDSDRVIACDEKGNLVDGDKIIYILANYLKEKGKLKNNIVVGTSHTNLGIQNALEEKCIKLLRADIGDKYVRELMHKTGAVIGGEQSGHIIIDEYSDTGDGILTAIQLCKIMKETGKTLSQLCDVKLYPQININIAVKDKLQVLNSEMLQENLNRCRTQLGTLGRVMVRASGTEPKIRIISECIDEKLAKDTAKQLEDTVEEIIKNLV